MSRPKCLRCGATSEWIEGKVPNEPAEGSFAAPSGSALRNNYEKERTSYWSEPCDTCIHRHKRPNNPTCQACIHYAR